MGESRKRYTTFTLDNSWLVEFPTPDGVLRLGPGLVRIDARFSIQQQDEEGYWWTILACQLRLADADGRLWQATSHFNASWLFYPLVDLSRRERGRWLRKAPAAWRKALQKRSLVREVPTTYDDRFYRFVWFDNTGFCWQFKYFGARFELAALDDSTILVCVSNLFCTWEPNVAVGQDDEPLPLPPPRPPMSDEEMEEQMERWEEAGEAGDVDDAAPLVYVIDAGRILFHDTDRYTEADGEWDTSSLPEPLVFRRMKGKGEPQSIVTFHPGANLTPVTRPTSAPADGFLTMNDPFGMVTFQTDEGSRLVVNVPSYDLRLDIHSDSASEPIDVLRCRVRLTDESGVVWEAITHCTPEVFFENLIDLDSVNAPFFAEPEPEVKWFLTDIRAHVDEVWRYGFIGPYLLAFRGEQTPRVALAIDEEAAHFIVRITGLVGRRRPVQMERDAIILDPEDRKHECQLWEQDAPLPPIVYTMALNDLAFRNTTFAVDDGFWHRNAIPIPVVFTRVGTSEVHGKARHEAGVG